MANLITAAFPQSPYPKGWFIVADSADIDSGDVKPLKYFGRNLVAWRGESGAAYVMDAHCRHLGAHMGYRGDEEQRKLVPAVVGEDIACPWHGWRWNSEGRNTCIPYKNEKPKAAARIRTYPTREWHGMILLWYAWDESEPEWEVPEFDEFNDPSFYPLTSSGICRWTRPGHCQQPMENSADFSHIHFVHGSGGMAEPLAMTCEKHRMVAQVEVLYGRPDKATSITPKGGKKAIVRLDHYGIGISVHRWGTQMWPTCLVTGFTPIDENNYEVSYHFVSKRGPGEVGEELQGKAARIFKMQTHVIEQDFFIWDHMEFLPNALYAASEAPLYGKLRHWASQFYPETADAYVDPSDDMSTLLSLDDPEPVTA
ncbi:Rieske 2Fe-2S domain-containing protein [Sphingobium sp. V4]|uniref:Rieske 2Fe-2S domain-containing protein n=1 Tax=Sphingobium sp. V4 TaxID=3038927 RepID=UPI002558232A|nr:Rieske 2Fe-2S domain-containing protein [Sphingobium sp. V4]WIW89540.1 Rieske 2Fe-2S domain-containing protein [Sphingobium sp. V4]